MSVLIRGMQMPKNCAECPVALSGKYCRINKTHTTYIKLPIRPDHCPLVELPEKHGRLIDAEALIDTLEQAIAIMEMMLKQLDLEADDGCLMELKAFRDIRDGIKEIDAVIEAEGEE